MKILVVGCGAIGRRHARNAAKIVDTAVVDTRSDLARKCAKEFRITAFPDLEAGLDWRPDGVIVATPTHMHISVANKAIDAGSDVLIEKPISNILNGVDVFLDRADTFGCKVFVVCNMRFHPAVAALRENLKFIGRPLFVRAHYGNYLPNMRPETDYRKLYCASRAQGGGVVLDAIHEIDYLIWFFGPVVNLVSSVAKLSNLDIDVEDYACFCLKHSSGVVSEIHLDYLRHIKGRGCEIVADQGMLLWQSEGKNPEICNVRLFLEQSGQWETLLSVKELNIDESYERLITYFVDAIDGKDVPLLVGRDAATELSVSLEVLKFAELEKHKVRTSRVNKRDN